ncbi:MAG TPA: DNA translocase FtsK 4TM domain-containing protein, partial [Thermogutta sp.]|nr:DNA translocase FtsK 4TM domain-containing protein [Thermogutta sp.]
MASLRAELGRDLVALLLLGVVLFFGASLITFDPADSPSDLVFPPHAQVTNVCGPVGATVAFYALEFLGIGAWYAVLSLSVLTIVLLLRQPLTRPNTR